MMSRKLLLTFLLAISSVPSSFASSQSPESERGLVQDLMLEGELTSLSSNTKDKLLSLKEESQAMRESLERLSTDLEKSRSEASALAEEDAPCDSAIEAKGVARCQ